ncbi:MAG TPA: glycoside hydrolase family 2 protein [Acidobacteriaceae bacterium]|nr:glycoside hydrolase family 2 protein [Acidobacteriaceae bacterium]
MKLFTTWCSTSIVLFGFGSILMPQLWGAANQSIAINTGWEFRQMTDVKGTAIQEKWLPAKVPGDVHLDLLRNKLIPPPFYRDNETKLQWIEDADWEYRTTISAGTDIVTHNNIDLVFDGLDTCASVYLNGTLVLKSDDMFRTYRIDAKPYLKRGANRLLVMFTSPIRCAVATSAKDQWHPILQVPTKSYILKAAYEYGWEGGPRFVTSGIWQPVRLEAWNSARISDFNIRQTDVTRNSAHIVADIDVVASENTLATIAVTGKHIFESASRVTVLHPGTNYLELPLTIEKPELWYPVGYGWQPIYDFHADIATGGVIQDSSDVHVPLRSLELRYVPDKLGHHYEFAVNGTPIFAKGAVVVPFDNFPNQVTNEQLRYILQSAIDANMNMIRVWGGGYYETKEFYQLCDELGILVWQDFMFDTPRQPGTAAFKQDVAQEAKDQLKRLHNFSSIGLWYGSEEPQSTFGKTSHDGTSEARIQMWKNYLTIFNGIIPTEVARYAPTTPYWPSAFGADYEGTKIENNRNLKNKNGKQSDGEAADINANTASVLDRQLFGFPYNEAEKRHYELAGKYGFPALPDMRTIETFTLPQDRTSLDTAVMKAHQKSGSIDVNIYKSIYDSILRNYGKPRDFSSMIYLSQILQAEDIKAVAEHLRQDQSHAMGSIFWQLNDCWPGITSSSIDYYGRWKALQYYARRFYSPMLVSFGIKDQQLDIYVTSDKKKAAAATLRVRIMKVDGTVMNKKSENITIPEFSSDAYIHIPINSFITSDEVDPAKIFAAAGLTIDGKQVSSNIIYFVHPKPVQLPTTHIESQLTEVHDSYNLHLLSKALARNVYISFNGHDVNLSDNYFDLLPGEPKDIRVNSSVDLRQSTKDIKITSLIPTTYIERQLTEVHGSYNLHLLSKALARDVYISFNNHDVELSDNYFDLLPGEPKDIRVNSSVDLHRLTKDMRIISLADAVVSNPADKGFAWK